METQAPTLLWTNLSVHCDDVSLGKKKPKLSAELSCLIILCVVIREVAGGTERDSLQMESNNRGMYFP